MNRHFFGMPSGLPLGNPHAYIVDSRADYDAPPWTQSWSAKIIEDELFLSAIHNSILHEDSVPAFRHVDSFQ